MRQFLEAVAQSLRNFGFTDAAADECSVSLRGVRFEVWAAGRRSFQFCGRTYRSGNVLQATLDLIQELPALLARRDREVERKKQQVRVDALNKSLKDYGLRVLFDSDAAQLIYTADLDKVERVAKQIAAAEEVVLQSVDAALERFQATFTSEGGFSLN